MDCLEAQRLISEKIDGEHIDPALIERAKAHCRECPECASYVRALVALRRTPLPEPPADLADRVIAAAAARVAAESQPTRATEPSPPIENDRPTISASEPVSFERLKAQLLDRRNRRSIVAWVSAAAVVLVVTGIVAVGGVRQIATPRTPDNTTFSVDDMSTGATTPDYTAPEAGGTGGDIFGGSPSAETTAQAPSYITVSGVVYRLSGNASGVDETALTRVGSTTSALHTALPPSAHDVLGLQDPARVYISDDEGGLLGFDLVTRTFDGRAYSLRSGEVSAFGQWPTLPSGVTRPTNADGSPEYDEAGTDDLGVTVYERRTGAEGVAVPPGTSGSDPAAGNPDWTWWVQL